MYDGSFRATYHYWGKGKIVETDENLFSRRKSRIGRIYPQTRNVFYAISDLIAATLIPFIRQ